MVVLHALRPNSRQTTVDYITSFKEYLSDWNVFFLHFAEPRPEALSKIYIDVFVINYDFLNYRLTPLWWHIRNVYKDIALKAQHRIALVQDDYWANKILDKWVLDWRIDKVLTPLSEGLDFLYKKSYSSTSFDTVLTGYVNTFQLKVLLNDGLTQIKDRPIDLGQRVRELPATLGKHAQAKSLQALKFAEICAKSGFIVDVSTKLSDSFTGPDWLKFLAKSKFTVSMKGGASLNDKYGLSQLILMDESQSDSGIAIRYLRILRNWYHNRSDEKYIFKAISPRIFDAAFTKTCQILAPDDYLGVLEPWKHFIPLEPSFSNINQVLEAMQDLEFAQKIADNCYEVLILSGNFTHEELVKTALKDLKFDSCQKTDLNELANLKAQLWQNHLVFAQFESSLHDAIQRELYSIWMLEGKKGLFRERAIFSEKSTDWSRTKLSEELKTKITENNLQTHLIHQINNILNGNLLKWQIWPWRPIL